MNKIYIPSLLFIFTCFAGIAQTQGTDSLQTNGIHEIAEVVVTGTRHKSDVRHLSQTVTVVDRARIENTLQPSLMLILTDQIP